MIASLPRRARARWILETLMVAVLLTVPLPAFRYGLTRSAWAAPIIVGVTIYVAVAIVRAVWTDMRSAALGRRIR